MFFKLNIGKMGHHRFFIHPSPAQMPQLGITRAAWTRRSRSETSKKPNRKSWKQRTDMYMRPFLLDVMHRGTCKVISAASTNADDMRNSLPSLRCKEADVFAMAYEPRKNERIEGKIGIVIDAIKENGIIFVE
ncbi:unnamed protein product [Spirodela intermedia]|uniref:Uncharacterized protein n=1 Tax=Spirodela intermedia TaxID=51605 RepID=A0A7I8JJH1_SPIIN|nr:unnamed protein product [Spirodela intermedia]CAA6669723.1 unnamed protein product [Spirodela intermedia]